MKKITIAVGSKCGPKLNAVTEALQSFSAALVRDAEFEVVGVEIESGVSHTPASRDELMSGARQRADALVEVARASGAAWQFFIGLEGGLDIVHEGVLMDIQMAEMDGFEATTALRRKEQSTGNHIPIIAMTAQALKGDQERCLAAGMDAYISKPIRTSELFAAIDKLIGTGSEPESLGVQSTSPAVPVKT